MTAVAELPAIGEEDDAARSAYPQAAPGCGSARWPPWATRTPGSPGRWASPRES